MSFDQRCVERSELKGTRLANDQQALHPWDSHSVVTSIQLIAEGSEMLKWTNDAFHFGDSNVDVARLPAGHPIDVSCRVRYGICPEEVK